MCACVASQSAPDAASFLQRVVAAWRDLCEYLVTVRNIFIYMDRCVTLRRD
jgi:hypothetical protein